MIRLRNLMLFLSFFKLIHIHFQLQYYYIVMNRIILYLIIILKYKI